MNDQEFTVDAIRSQYARKQEGSLDALKAMDTKVKRPARLFGYIYGSLSALLMGAGMSLVMTNIGDMLGVQDPIHLGIVVGLVGMAMTLTTYPIYSKILASRKQKFAAEILALSEQVEKG